MRDGPLLPLLAVLAAATAASCSGAGGGGGAGLPEHATLEDARRLDAPGEVADCRPCAVIVEPGAAPWAFAFEVAEVPGEGRAVRRVAATPPEWGIAAAALDVPDMAPVPPGQGFFFGPQDLDSDGYADLLLATDRGVANAYARYWRFDPAARAFVATSTCTCASSTARCVPAPPASTFVARSSPMFAPRSAPTKPSIKLAVV